MAYLISNNAPINRGHLPPPPDQPNLRSVVPQQMQQQQQQMQAPLLLPKPMPAPMQQQQQTQQQTQQQQQHHMPPTIIGYAQQQSELSNLWSGGLRKNQNISNVMEDARAAAVNMLAKGAKKLRFKSLESENMYQK